MLHKLKREYDELVQQWTKDYIWQKEPFELKLYQPGVDPAMQKKGWKRVHLPTPCPPLQCMSSSPLCSFCLQRKSCLICGAAHGSAIASTTNGSLCGSSFSSLGTIQT